MLDPRTVTIEVLEEEIDFISHLESEIVSILDGLTDLEKNIIILRYGLVHKSLDCPQTAKVLNLEWNDVIKIENQTLKKLKENSNINLLYELIQQRDK